MREEDDKHAEMIHFLRNNTQLSRFSRAEVRDFIERLDSDGYEVVKKKSLIGVFQTSEVPGGDDISAAIADVDNV